MTGKTVIITGASSGLGLEAARCLCEGGYDVILACRDEQKASRGISRIKQQHPNALATYMQIDLAELASVRKFVDEFHATGKKVDILINNAGELLNFSDTKIQCTKDNFELTMGTNYLGHFLLTNLLLDDLKRAAAETGNARVIIVTSSLHDPKVSRRTRSMNLQPIDPDDLFLFKERSYTGLQAYKNSQAANILFACALAQRLNETGVKVNAICPGIVPGSDLLRHSSAAQKLFYRCVLHGMLRFIKLTRTVAQAAANICALATDDKFKDASGKYFVEGEESSPSEETQNVDLRAKLWDLSGRYTCLEGYEPLVVSAPPSTSVVTPPAEDNVPPKDEEKENDVTKAPASVQDGESKADDSDQKSDKP